MRDFDKEIQELERKIEELKLEKKRVQGIPQNQRLAEALHSKQCHFAHEDQCGWFYESWDNVGYSRKSYLDKANKMLAEMNFEQAMKVIKWL